MEQLHEYPLYIGFENKRQFLVPVETLKKDKKRKLTIITNKKNKLSLSYRTIKHSKWAEFLVKSGPSELVNSIVITSIEELNNILQSSSISIDNEDNLILTDFFIFEKTDKDQIILIRAENNG